MKNTAKNGKMTAKRLMAAAATVGMAVSMMTPAWAAVWDIANGDITVTAKENGQYVSQGSVVDQKEEDETIITGTSDENTVTIEAEAGQTADVTLDDLHIDVSSDPADLMEGETAITIKGEGDVNLELDGTSEVKSGNNHAGVEKNDSDSTGTLTIDDKDEDGGSLKATGGDNGAGIGGGIGQSSSNLVIEGGTIEAEGVGTGAGIGGGDNGFGTVTINDGEVDAKGSDGAGIGGGHNGSGTVTINGGKVDAKSDWGAGIGGGLLGNGTVMINGGEVDAKGGNSGVGIGGGDGGIGTVTLNDGTITQQPDGSINNNHTGHNWDNGQTDGCKTEYTCTGTGCGATKTVFDHHMVNGAVTTAPTCTQTGKQNTYCDKGNCGFEKEVTLAALGHIWDDGVVTTEPTYTTEGVKTYTCTGCGVKKTESIAKLEPEENSAAPAPMDMTDQFGAPIAYEQSVENGRVVFAAPAENAVLTGSLAALAELKAQGADTIVFRTQLKETGLNIDWLLAQGSADDVFALTHKGAEVSLTVAGWMVRL